jgi:hypothetical protein
MNRSLKTAQTLLHRILNAAPWALIAGAVVTPAYAATGIAIDDLKLPTIDSLTLPILLGSIALLVIALVLKTLRHKHAPAQIPSSNGFKEGIGRYRLQLGRGDSD